MSIDTKKLSPEVASYIKALKDENERLKQQNANLTEQIIRNQNFFLFLLFFTAP